MKRIRVLRNLGSGLPPYKEGQLVDVDEAVANRLLALRLAEELPLPPPPPVPARDDLPLPEELPVAEPEARPETTVRRRERHKHTDTRRDL